MVSEFPLFSSTKLFPAESAVTLNVLAIIHTEQIQHMPPDNGLSTQSKCLKVFHLTSSTVLFTKMIRAVQWNNYADKCWGQLVLCK